MNHEVLTSHHIIIDEHSQIGDARRRAITLAGYLQFNETESGKVGIVVTEAASNIIKHAGRGKIIIRVLEQNGQKGLEILAIDNGPGMDKDRCLEDGYSTAGSPGTGLGAMSRLSAVFDLYSAPNKGTVLVAQLWPVVMKTAISPEVGGVCVPVTGEILCGDGWAFHRHLKCLSVIAVDGLGHGPLAAIAADEALRTFRENPDVPPAEMLRLVHGALLSTRGAAVAVALIDPEQHAIHFAGVGNISGMLFDGEKTRGLPSSNGTVGHQLHKVQEIKYMWPTHGWVVLHSDGLFNRWKLDDYPGLLRHHPSIIAGILYRDFQRGRDDAMVVVVKNN